MMRLTSRAFDLGLGAAELVERSGEDGIGLVGVGEDQRASEHEGRLPPADRVGEQRVRLLQVLDRAIAAQKGLRGAELGQELAAFLLGRRLYEAPAQVGDGALRRAARGGSAGGVAQGRDDSWIAGRRCAQEVGGHPLWSCAGGVEELSRTGVARLALRRREGFIDGRPNERMDEPERRPFLQDVDLSQ
jgi:hypothetical protein